MVLIDTSAWIRFFLRREPFLSGVATLLRHRRVVRHALIYGELLVGDCGGRTLFLEDYETRPEALFAPHEEVVFLVRTRKLQGRGIGWIDAHLLASALADRMQLFTADARLATIAEELGCAYKV